MTKNSYKYGWTATFFGGVVPSSEQEQKLAHGVGRALAQAGFLLQHGGYNGLMEEAARGAAHAAGNVVAVTLSDVNWGKFNPYISGAIQFPSLGDRLHQFLDPADLIIAMGGGIGTLHELTAAIWYAGNIRPVPVWLTGATAVRLSTFLRSEHWLFESPTRPLGFLREIPDMAAFRIALVEFVDSLRNSHNDADPTAANGHG
ncbi:LOG family protein [Nocardia terpenica]|uniref:SLOG cluster 4 domain-containing protein n=1 Tax=Nocardia terpenica TaxID=455432 RepID=UPI0003138DFA|nr:LOG family protein [Nocardia terpenica]NQE86280.1 DNA transporter [Nocardia terpenica]